jgi:HAD superfamily hydrolase (TIGR01509 family)
MQQPHAETGGLIFVRVQDAHEEGPIGCVLEIVQLVLERGRHPLDRMAEQVQKQKALHLESDVRIEHDAQAVEDAGPWRLQVPVFEDEAVLDNAVGRADPEAIRNIRQQRISDKAAAYVRMNGAIVALIAKLASQGMVLAVVSNGFEEDVIQWSSCPLATYFQCAAFSCVEHVAKPEAEIYLRVLRELGVEPAAAAYIGDGADDELVGQKRLACGLAVLVGLCAEDGLVA